MKRKGSIANFFIALTLLCTGSFFAFVEGAFACQALPATGSGSGGIFEIPWSGGKCGLMGP